MGGLWARLKLRKEEPTPIDGFTPRVSNIFALHYKGLIGGILPVLALSWQFVKFDNAKTVVNMWIFMFWIFLFQPVNIPVVGLVPLFMLPMGGVMSTDMTCAAYVSEGIILFVTGSMLMLLLNNCGYDRRLILWFLSSGDDSQFCVERLVYKASMAAFVTSMFSSRLIVCNIVTQYMTALLMNLQKSTSRGTDPCFDEVRYIVNSAIQSSSSIGSIGILHSSYSTLAFRAIFYENKPKMKAWPDLFNYLEYSSFAIPVAIVMFLVNVTYHIVLLNIKIRKPMSAASMTAARTALLNDKKEIPKKITLHEKLAVFFTLCNLLMFFGRWSKYFQGWSDFRKYNELPGILDATVAIMFVVLLHALPSGCRWLKLLRADKKSAIGAAKTESGILWWRFVDKNSNYGYIYLIGAGAALDKAVRMSSLDKYITSGHVGSTFHKPFLVYILLICFITVLLANIMSSTTVVVVILPLVLNMHYVASSAATEAPAGLVLRDDGTPAATGASPKNLELIYLGALAVGIGSNLGFSAPFLYTPAYFCHYTGKVPKLKMFINGIVGAALSFLVLWISIVFYAPMLWDQTKISYQDMKPEATATTTAPPAATP